MTTNYKMALCLGMDKAGLQYAPHHGRAGPEVFRLLTYQETTLQTFCAGNMDIATLVARSAEAAATMHEEGKCVCMDCGLAALLVTTAQDSTLTAAAAAAVAGAFRTFTTADDPKPPASRWGP